MRPQTRTKPEIKPPSRGGSAETYFAVVFGLVLGLALWKFGNPVILDSNVAAPSSWKDAWELSWPPRWSFWFLLPVAIYGAWLALSRRTRWAGSPWLWILPLAWLGWQLVAAAQTVNGSLTTLTLLQLGGCALCYFLGGWVLSEEKLLRLLLIGVLAAFGFCLVRAAKQSLFEFPREKQALLEGERVGWTNFAPQAVLEMKQEGFIITTNGADVLNPIMLAKYNKGRAFGTLIYPNALAGAVLLLFPVALALAVTGTQDFRGVTRWAVLSLTLFLGIGSLLWSGSKSGWLIALGMVGVAAFRLNWPVRWKWGVLFLVLGLGLTAFAVRFHHYFASGATSVSARLDYWQAAARNTLEHPLLGSGPGTFQHPYARLKRPESEMARLAHNDYLEQFSDSGVPGGVAYLVWIASVLAIAGRKVWSDSGPVPFALFLGSLGWFVQGCSEFSLYVPALAWPAFTFLGVVAGLKRSAQVPATAVRARP